MAQMHAVRLHHYGAAENLIYEEIERPEPQPGEVLVRIQGVGLNPVDWQTRQGRDETSPLASPIILGWDIAGVVAATGEGVGQVVPGDEVFGMARFPDFGDAYAEYATVPASDLAKKPANVSFAEAAATPLSALTAWQGLFDVAHLEAGQKALIHAAAGGVGHIAAQLAKWKGAHVIGTASAHNADFLRSLGVDEVVDYKRQRFEDVARDVDVVMNTQDRATLERSFAVLKPGGFLVSITHAPDEALARAHQARAAQILVHVSGTQMAEVAKLLATGKLRIVIARTFPLAKAAAAHQILELGHTRGKIVLTP